MILLNNKEVQLLDKHQVRNSIFLPLNLPFSLYGSDIILEDCFKGTEILERESKRKIYYVISNRSVKNQDVAPHPTSFFMSVNLSQEHPKFEHTLCRLMCIIEIQDDEVEPLREKKDDHIFIDNLIQRVLEIFFYSYNIKHIGRDYQNPNARLIAPVSYSVSSNDDRKSKLEKNNGLLMIYPMPNMNALEFNISIKQAHNENWIYFWGKAISDFKFYNYYDTIINCAISYEAYFHYIVKSKSLSRNYLYKTDGDFRYATNIINKLYEDKKIVTNNLSLDDLITFNKIILGNRNNIIHGASIDIYDLHDDAIKSINALYEFYKTQDITN